MCVCVIERERERGGWTPYIVLINFEQTHVGNLPQPQLPRPFFTLSLSLSFFFNPHILMHIPNCKFVSKVIIFHALIIIQ